MDDCCNLTPTVALSRQNIDLYMGMRVEVNNNGPFQQANEHNIVIKHNLSLLMIAKCFN